MIRTQVFRSSKIAWQHVELETRIQIQVNKIIFCIEIINPQVRKYINDF